MGVSPLGAKSDRLVSKPERTAKNMSKILAVLILLMMAVHIVRPLGVPGLRRRRDVWKLAVLALGLMVATVALREITGA